MHYPFAVDDERIMKALETYISHRYIDKTGKVNYLRGTAYLLYDIPHPFLIYGMNYNPVTEEYEMVQQLCTDHPAVSSSTLSGGSYVPPSIIAELLRVQLHPYLEGVPLHNRYLIFPKRAEEIQKCFVISGSFAGSWTPQSTEDYNEGKPAGYLMFVSMSDNYNRYLDEAIRLQILDESDDMTRIYIRDNMYTNVNGGVGLFAATFEEKGDWARVYMNLDAWERYWSEYERDPGQFYDRYGQWHYNVNDREGLDINTNMYHEKTFDYNSDIFLFPAIVFAQECDPQHDTLTAAVKTDSRSRGRNERRYISLNYSESSSSIR